MNETSTMDYAHTIGIDLGDVRHQVAVLDPQGRIVMEGKVDNTRPALEAMFAKLEPSLIALEAGTHSPWISATLEGWGHTVLVANPGELPAITKSKKKTDQRDARMLAKLARVDPELLKPLLHRSPQAQTDLALLKARHALVKVRSSLIGHCRGIMKSAGGRLPKCSADAFAKQALKALPLELFAALEPLVRQVGELTEKIQSMERKIEALALERYPEHEQLQAVGSVGRLTALCFMLVLDRAERFEKSRSVGAYVGLVPKKDQSGQVDKQCRITKDGNPYLRVLLVQCAQHLLSRRGKDCELRQWGLKLCERGGKAAKKRAVIATARKLAVQLHAVWVGGKPYDPFHAQKQQEERQPTGRAGKAGGGKKRGRSRGVA